MKEKLFLLGWCVFFLPLAGCGSKDAGGRNRIQNFNAWMRLDLEYIDRWSLILDMKILLKMISAALFAIGAK